MSLSNLSAGGWVLLSAAIVLALEFVGCFAPERMKASYMSAMSVLVGAMITIVLRCMIP